MPNLITETPISIASGLHNLEYDISSGTAKLQYSANNKPFKDVPNTDKTATTGINVRLPSCRIQSVLTGDATLFISTIER